MKATQLLHDLGQSLWLDNITRDLLTSGTLKRYIDELSVTGLTSNPTIFDHAIKNSTRLRRRDPRRAGKRQVRRGAVFRSGAGRSDAGRRSLSTRSTTGPTAWTAGYRWRSRRCWPTTRPARSRRRRNCTPGRDGRIYSSRFPAPRKGCPRSRRRSSPACRST